jgi:GntR family phosphonate transport system transcriptional regulator
MAGRMHDISMTDAPSERLSRQDGISLWRQIADRLQDEIGSGAFPPASRLPTEAQLAATFGVNRHTVRRALEELVHAGLVRVEQGRGSFVAEEKIDYAVEPRTRFSEWIRRHNMEPSGLMLQLREVAAEAQVAAGLGLRPGARVVLFERLGLADGRPVALIRHHFPGFRLPGLLAALQLGEGVTVALRAVGVPDYMRQSTRVSARLPSADEAKKLRMPRGRPVLVAENVNVDQDGGIIEFAIGLYPTPRVQIVFEP